MAEGRDRRDERRNDDPLVVKRLEEIKRLQNFSALSTDSLIELAEKMGEILATRVRLKTSQIRKFLDALHEIKSKGTQKPEGARSGEQEATSFFRSECLLLKPKLAYAAGRQDEVKPLMEVLTPCIDKVRSREDFLCFYRLVESIIAYHRFYGGRD